MDSLLFQTITGIMALFIFWTWLRPGTFRFLLDKGSTEPSLGRIGQFTALVVSTWAFMSLVLSNLLTEWFFTAYMLAWAAAQFGSIWLKVKGNAAPDKKSHGEGA